MIMEIHALNIKKNLQAIVLNAINNYVLNAKKMEFIFVIKRLIL